MRQLINDKRAKSSIIHGRCVQTVMYIKMSAVWRGLQRVQSGAHMHRCSSFNVRGSRCDPRCVRIYVVIDSWWNREFKHAEYIFLYHLFWHLHYTNIRALTLSTYFPPFIRIIFRASVTSYNVSHSCRHTTLNNHNLQTKMIFVLRKTNKQNNFQAFNFEKSIIFYNESWKVAYFSTKNFCFYFCFFKAEIWK